MYHEEQKTLEQALSQEIEVYTFGRSGNSLPDSMPPFNGKVMLDPLNEKFKIRISSQVATFKSEVQPSEPATVEELKAEVAKIEGYNKDQLANYISQFVPKDNQPIIP